MVLIFVGSKSELKIRATRNAFKELLPDQNIEIEGFDVSSEVNSQPIGNEETLLGAQNRLKNAKDTLIKKGIKYDYIVAMENGLIEVNKYWFDIGWVVVEGNRSISVSNGVQFPSSYAKEGLENGFSTITDQSDICKKYQIDGSDIHRFLTDGVFPREILLLQATRVALSQLIHNNSQHRFIN